MLVHTVIEIPLYKRAKKGSFNAGLYFKLSETQGVKLPGFPEKLEAEARFLEELDVYCPGIFPRFYGIVDVIYRAEIVPSLLIEHIPGKNLRELYGKGYTWEFGEHAGQIASNLIRIKADLNMRWTDDHENNIILTPGGLIRFVDADPTYFRSLNV